MPSEPSVTTIVPTLNEEQYIREAVSSLIPQGESVDYQLIVAINRGAKIAKPGSNIVTRADSHAWDCGCMHFGSRFPKLVSRFPKRPSLARTLVGSCCSERVDVGGRCLGILVIGELPRERVVRIPDTLIEHIVPREPLRSSLDVGACSIRIDSPFRISRWLFMSSRQNLRATAGHIGCAPSHPTP